MRKKLSFLLEQEINMQKTIMTTLGICALTSAIFFGASSAQAATAQSIHAVTHQSVSQNKSYSYDCVSLQHLSSPDPTLYQECLASNNQNDLDASGNPKEPVDTNN
jgi:hypothetical protein